MIPSFGHHVIPLLPLPGAAGALGGKAHLAAVKAACKSAARIHGVLQLAGRFELAAIPAAPDFFDSVPGLAKARNLAWETMKDTPRIQWVMPTRHPENINQSLPATWSGKGFENVCVGLVIDAESDFTEKLQALRKAPVRHRMIYLAASNPLIADPEELQGIDWVVLDCGQSNAELVESLGAMCCKAGSAFLIHQGETELSGVDSCPLHPFGSLIDIGRPTLPGLRTSSHPFKWNEQSESLPASAHDDTASSPSMISNTPHAIQSSTPMSEHTSSVTDDTSEPVDSTTYSPSPDSQAADDIDHCVVDSRDHQGTEFDQLDQVVRRGLSTFIEVGRALAQIREKALWKMGGHDSWAAYCISVGGLSKQHANRLIISAQIATEITEVEPIGSTQGVILPETESQIRPLASVKSPEKRAKIWSLAVARSDGKPTGAIVTAVIKEVIDQPAPQPRTPVRKQSSQAHAVLLRLREAVLSGTDRAHVEKLLTELEKLLASP